MSPGLFVLSGNLTKSVDFFQSIIFRVWLILSIIGQMSLSNSEKRLDWPVVWPRGTYVDIVQSPDVPQLEPLLSLRSKLKTPEPSRALRRPADLTRSLDKRVENAITLKLDHGPERAEGLYQGFLRCVDVERVSDIS